MEPYKNLGGNSNIASYQIGQDFIEVQFRDDSIYRYSNTSAGIENVQAMKELARNGQGLNSFINTQVRNDYESKR